MKITSQAHSSYAIFFLAYLLSFVFSSVQCSSQNITKNDGFADGQEHFHHNTLTKPLNEEPVHISRLLDVVNITKELITGSNFKALSNIDAIKNFKFSQSSVFYLVLFFTLLMLFIAIWSVFKDKALNRDLWELPNKKPSWLYKISTYIVMTHTFFNIFVLYEKEKPRALRSALLYSRITGLMTFSALFMQNLDRDFGQKIALSIITTITITFVNMAIEHLLFKRAIKPKLRRKRLANTNNNNNNANEENMDRQKQIYRNRLSKIFNYIGYSMIIAISIGYIYIIFAVTAVNSQTSGGQSSVNKWLLDFLQPLAIDFFIAQASKVIVHMTVIYLLRSPDKKKFLCFSRKSLSKMVNPVVFDYQKRFTALDRLYGNKPPTNDGLDNLDIDEEDEEAGLRKPQPGKIGQFNHSNTAYSRPPPAFRLPGRDEAAAVNGTGPEGEGVVRSLVRGVNAHDLVKNEMRGRSKTNRIRNMILEQGRQGLTASKVASGGMREGNHKLQVPEVPNYNLDDPLRFRSQSHNPRKAGMLEVVNEEKLRGKVLEQNQEELHSYRVNGSSQSRMRGVKGRRRFDEE